MRCFALLLLPALLQAGARLPAAQYPAHTTVPDVAAFGAAYSVHSFSNGRQTFYTGGYLTVEICVEPAGRRELPLSSNQFLLRINGKRILEPGTPGEVAASLKYPDWVPQPQILVEAGDGQGHGVTLGRPPRVGRFPGDPTATQTRLPDPPRAPDQTGVERAPAESGGDVALAAALPEGATAAPVSGYLYFRFDGKAKNVHKVELLWKSPTGECTLPLN